MEVHVELEVVVLYVMLVLGVLWLFVSLGHHCHYLMLVSPTADPDLGQYL